MSVTPVFSRRSILAALASGLTASAAVSLAIFGGATTVDKTSFDFSRGTSLASGEEDRLRGFLSGALSDDRSFLTIVGHSGTNGDSQANQELSDQRAVAILQIARNLGLTDDQIQAIGVGGTNPLPRLEGESDRAYQARLARVDVSLQMRQ